MVSFFRNLPIFWKFLLYSLIVCMCGTVITAAAILYFLRIANLVADSHLATQQAAAIVQAANDGIVCQFILLGVGIVVCVGGALLIAVLLISKPLKIAIDGVNRLQREDVDFEIDERNRKRKDEIGLMMRALVNFRQTAIDKVAGDKRAAEERARHEADRHAREEREVLAIQEISGLCEQLADGRLDRRIDETGKDGFLLKITQRLNGLAGLLQSMAQEMASVTGAMAGGDLTQHVNGQYGGVFGTLKDSVNGMAGKLRDLAGDLSISAGRVRDASGEILAGSQDLAQRTESQAASIEETAASMHQITATVKQNADNAQAANQLAVAARDTADRGGSVVADAVGAVTRIEESARKISDIVSLIDEIAFQTNLLALNASVEAARAGEAGKGFAVVAQEVRALAQRSANASKDIKALIAESNAQVKTGAELVGRTGQSLGEIVGSVKKVADIVAEIAAASREQATGLEQINTAVAGMDELTQRNGALVEETAAAAQSLADQAGALAKLVAFFDTGARSTAATAPKVGAVRAKPPSPPAAVVKPAPVPASPVRPTAPGRAIPAAGADDDWQEF